MTKKGSNFIKIIIKSILEDLLYYYEVQLLSLSDHPISRKNFGGFDLWPFLLLDNQPG